VIGLDLGAHSIKAMAISEGAKGIQVDAIADIPIPQGILVDNHLEDIHKISFFIRQLQQYFPSHYKHAAIAVAGVDVMTKVLEIEASVNHYELETLVEIEIENSIPFPRDEIFVDFEIQRKDDENTGINNVLVSTARKEHVLSHVQCVKEGGYVTTIVDIADHALTRAVEFLLSEEELKQGVAIVDIGVSQMTLNVVYQGNIIFSRSKNHGRNITEDKPSPETSLFNMATKHELKDSVEDESLFIDSLINHLRIDLKIFSNSTDTVHVNQLILTGGGALLPGLVARFQDNLALTIVLAQPELVFNSSLEQATFLHSGAKYMLALGLALRGVKRV